MQPRTNQPRTPGGARNLTQVCAGGAADSSNPALPLPLPRSPAPPQVALRTRRTQHCHCPCHARLHHPRWRCGLVEPSTATALSTLAYTTPTKYLWSVGSPEFHPRLEPPLSQPEEWEVGPQRSHPLQPPVVVATFVFAIRVTLPQLSAEVALGLRQTHRGGTHHRGRLHNRGRLHHGGALHHRGARGPHRAVRGSGAAAPTQHCLGIPLRRHATPAPPPPRMFAAWTLA